MHPILLYLVKMLLCSGILFGYYRMALYNEKFHQWNRFYLIAALALSVIVPFIEIPLVAEEQPVGIIYIIETMPASIVAKSAPLFTAENGTLAVATFISLVLFAKLVWGLYKSVFIPYRKGEVSAFNDISIIVTETPEAPYSFFRWLFWRSDLSPDEEAGKNILEHELTHIREKHSADKLFVELLLVVFWCNPFFWLIRKELYTIHEFLADRKAVTGNNGAAFAQMLLCTINASTASSITNPFFSSQIKRRLNMITSSHKPQFSYLRRISALLAMAGVSILLMLTLEKGMAQTSPPPPPAPPPPPTKISLPDSIVSVNVNTQNGKSIATIKLKNGKVRTMPVDEAIKKGYPVPPPPPPPPAPPAAPASPTPPDGKAHVSLKSSFVKGKEPLIIYAGIIISQEQFEQIDPNNIERIEVLKDETAINKYGEKGKNGVIIIAPKGEPKKTESNSRYGDVVVVGYKAPKVDDNQREINRNSTVNIPDNAHVILNGNPIDKEEIKNIDPLDIEYINVLKGDKAKEKYGNKGDNGVIEIFTNAIGGRKVFTKTEDMPKFPGGGEAWRMHLMKNLRYPDAALKNGVQGEVHVSFLVDVFGNLSEFKIEKEPGAGLGEEAIRVIKEGPKWEPATQNGKTVNARVVQVITFRLE